MARVLSKSTRIFYRLLPSQVGKTTVAEGWLSSHSDSLYLNWDIPEDRESILKTTFMSSLSAQAVALDEIHKYARIA